MDNEKQEYDRFVELSPQGSLFHKSWWLDAAAQKDYEILTVKKNDRIVAAWPLTFRKFAGFNLIIPPQLTPILGIMHAPPSKTKYSERLSDEIGIMNDLLKLLPKHSFFCQRFPVEFTNWLPLYWAGFRQTTRYTYVIEDLSDLDKVWENVRYGTKYYIHRAQKSGIRIVSDFSLEELLDLNELTYKRQKLELPYRRDYVYRLDEACIKNNARKLFFAVDGDGQVHAAVYIVFDEKEAYYLLGGGDPCLNHFGAHYLALWEAIKYASHVSRSFNFEGSMHSNIEPVFRGFGGVQKPYMEITGGSLLMEAAFTGFKNIWSKGGIPSKICRRLFL